MNIHSNNRNFKTTADDLIIIDHMGGFDANLKNDILDDLSKAGYNQPIYTEYIFNDKIKNLYSNLDLRTKIDITCYFLKHFENYQTHPKINIKNFLCSFNGSDHVSRKLLTACLHKMKLFNPNYCSKNYTHSVEQLDGHITDYMGVDDRYYRKFFISEDSHSFFQTLYSFGHVRFDHDNNIYNLENKLTESFVHIVSESMATSYYPFVTEKFLYSVVTRGLFLAYAQPGWHAHIKKYYGFKLYTKLFDYRFDTIKNPVERLVELITMVSKFSKLSNDELYDLYLIELENINYNFDHYYSGDFFKILEKI